MKSMPWVLLIAWGAFVFYGHQQASYLTTTCSSTLRLPVNHQLVLGDLRCTPAQYQAFFIGKYMGEAVEKNSLLNTTAVVLTPTVSVESGRAVVEVQFVPRPQNDIDAGSEVDLRDAGVAKAHARVVALLCTSIGTSSCPALVSIPRDSGKEIQPGSTYEATRSSAPK